MVVYTTSDIVHECRTLMDESFEHCAPMGTGTCYGNIIADSLARKGAYQSAVHTDIFCGLPLSACKNRVETCSTNKAQALWNTRITWPSFNRHKTSFLFRNQHFRYYVNVLPSRQPTKVSRSSISRQPLGNLQCKRLITQLLCEQMQLVLIRTKTAKLGGY